MSGAGQDYTALILAGGQATRMGGADKGLVRLNQAPLIEWTLAALAAQSVPPARILISANRNLAAYAAYGHPVLPDTLDGFQGPLSGMLAALQSTHLSTTGKMLVLPCDAASLPDDFAAHLLARAAQGAEAVSAADPQQWHPTLLLLDGVKATSLLAYLDSGQRSIRGWLAGLHHATVEFSTPFANSNTPDDLARLGAMLPPGPGKR